MGGAARSFIVGWASLLAMLGCNAISGADALGLEDRATTSGSSSSSGDTSASSTSSSGSTGESSSGASSSGTSGASSSGAPSSGASSSASSSSSGASTSSASSASSSGAPDGSAVIDETFATEASCVGGTTTNGATKSYAAELGVTGGACMVCATSAGAAYFELTAVAPKKGQLELEAHARRPAGRAKPGNVSVVLTLGGANISSSKSISENQWTRMGGTSVTVTSGATINLRIGMESAAVDDCILIDDVRVTIE